MIILASKSPRRQELLSRLGLSFTVRAANIDETMNPSAPVSCEVERVCRRKAAAVAETAQKEDIIISADTVVVIDHTVLGKPKDREDAFRMLRSLSGRTHQVMTGLCVRQGSTVQSEVIISDVTFRALTDDEIAAYIATGEPMDKAGSYGVQGCGAIFVSRLEGDYFSVMGLPLFTLATMLRACGVEILSAKGDRLD